jgi:hypothetical protein
VAERRFVFTTRTSVTSKAPPEVVYDTIADLRAHLMWSGERASDDTFKLLTLDAPDGPASVGTTFDSTGANFNGVFRDRSVVTDATRPRRFMIDTDSRLNRKRGKPWDVHFVHRYDIAPEAGGSRITYTETIERVNYVPYWLQTWLRPLSRIVINRADVRQLRNLAALAEERSARDESSPTHDGSA